MERPADIETGEFNKQASLVYTVGHTSPAGNYMLYTTLVSSLAHMFLERCKTKPASKSVAVPLIRHHQTCSSLPPSLPQPRQVAVSSTRVAGWMDWATRLSFT